MATLVAFASVRDFPFALLMTATRLGISLTTALLVVGSTSAEKMLVSASDFSSKPILPSDKRLWVNRFGLELNN